MTELQRIKIAIKALISLDVAKNQEEIGLLMGYKNKSSFSQILNGKVPLSKDFVERLCKIDNRISKTWIVSEIGNVLRNPDKSKQVYKDFNNDISNIVNEPSEVYNNYPGIPLVTVTAIGGFGNAHFAISKQDVKEYYVIPKFKHKQIDFMIEVEGSSMYPKYNSGDVVACKIINEDGFIQWNKTHVIATKDQGIIIKRIKKNDDDSFLMVSDNKSYDPFTVNKNEIDGIAIVVGVIRLE